MKIAFQGKVTQGVSIGAKFGVATANLDFFPLLPDLKEGVYFVNVKYDNQDIGGILHFGMRKTFESGFGVEVHLLDFDQNIYGKTLTIEPLKFWREVKKFQNADLLFTQIEQDIVQAEKFFMRRNILNKWRNISSVNLEKLNINAVSKISEHDTFLKSKNICIYAPKIDSEINFTEILMQKFPDKNFYFPRVKNDILEFYLVSNFSDLKKGAFSVLEPIKNTEKLLDFNIIDFIFVPALAADISGDRLGRGRGFYDRFLETCPDSAYKICVLPSFAITKKIPIQPHDQVVDEVLSI